MSMEPNSATYAQAQDASGERRTLRRVLLLGIPLFLIAWCLLPGVGPVFRLFNVPATSMAPTLPLGSMVVVSRASYGYSGHSFDGLDLPIAGRWPAIMPQRGDIVVFRLPRDPATFYIKRVIGLPGDRVQLQEGQLLINGKLVQREPADPLPDPFGEKDKVASYVERLPEGAAYRIIESEGDQGFLDNTQVFEVPPGHLFMMGDNRDNSSDSRVPAEKTGVGFVPVEFVLGRVVATLW